MVNQTTTPEGGTLEGILRSIIKDTLQQTLSELLPSIILQMHPQLSSPEKQLYTMDEVCQRLNICRSTYRNWARDGRLRETRLGGKRYIDRQQLDSLILTTIND